MAWKPKEPEIPFHEALDLAKTQLRPQWLNAEPQFCTIPDEAGAFSIYPFESDFFKAPILFVYLDPASAAGEYVLKLVSTWSQRYDGLALRILVVFKIAYPALSTPEFFSRILRQHDLHQIACIDADGGIAKALGVKRVPDVFVYDATQETANLIRCEIGPENDWLYETECALQHHLRQTDPGLPLDPPMRHAGVSLEDTVDLKPNDPRVKIQGASAAKDGYVSINSSKTAITLVGELPNFYLTARTNNPSGDKCRVVVEVDGAPIFQQFAGSDLHFDDSGASHLNVTEARIYRVMTGFRKKSYTLKLSFPHGDLVGIDIFGLQFV